jgi:hypothetical protein
MPSFGFFRKSQVIGHQFSLICPHSLHKCFIYQWELSVFGAKSQIWSDRDHHREEERLRRRETEKKRLKKRDCEKEKL